jgi:hypothetical protein
MNGRDSIAERLMHLECFVRHSLHFLPLVTSPIEKSTYRNTKPARGDCHIRVLVYNANFWRSHWPSLTHHLAPCSHQRYLKLNNLVTYTASNSALIDLTRDSGNCSLSFPNHRSPNYRDIFAASAAAQRGKSTSLTLGLTDVESPFKYWGNDNHSARQKDIASISESVMANSELSYPCVRRFSTADQ